MPSNAKQIFFCSECGHESAKWSGQCPACKSWNTMSEAPRAIRTKGTKGSSVSRTFAGTKKDNAPVAISEIKSAQGERYTTGFDEFDRVLGGGVVKGGLVLIGGDPGIGKSTLILQMCANMAQSGKKVLYVSGEESASQIKMRADRIGGCKDGLSILCETGLENIYDTVSGFSPDILVIDSIQTIYLESLDSAPGSPGQVRECTMLLLKLAKEEGISVFIVGHVTKEGIVAGPKMLEHMTDTVLYLEGEKNAAYRILRGVKNRFGATNEIGVFEMRGGGLFEVANPSAYMLSGSDGASPGSVISCLVEGTRPIMLEVQALVTRSDFGIPRRTASGYDYNRVNLLMAVMEKRSGLHLSGHDAYINIAGGMKVTEPATDLAVVLALAGSFKNKELAPETVCFGEVGLSGEVRAVSRAADRVRESAKLSFKNCILPYASMKEIKNTIGEKYTGINIIPVKNIKEAIDLM